jgi:cell division protein FtsW
MAVIGRIRTDRCWAIIGTIHVDDAAASCIGRQSIALDRLFAGGGTGRWDLDRISRRSSTLAWLKAHDQRGLTLPLMSYGGSAILMNLVALAVVRIDYENRY